MEVAPLDASSGSYQNALATYVHGDLADVIWSSIAKKSRKYGRRRTYEIHLLLYSTDWRFYVATGVLYLLAMQASANAHAFTSISYYRPDDQNKGEFQVIYPCPVSTLETIMCLHYEGGAPCSLIRRVRSCIPTGQLRSLSAGFIRGSRCQTTRRRHGTGERKRVKVDAEGS